MKKLVTTTATSTTTIPPEEYDYDPDDFCARFWHPSCREFGWNLYTVELVVVILLLLLHVSMIVFLVAHGRKDKAFRQAFYVQYVALSIVDCVRVAWVRKRPAIP